MKVKRKRTLQKGECGQFCYKMINEEKTGTQVFRVGKNFLETLIMPWWCKFASKIYCSIKGVESEFGLEVDGHVMEKQCNSQKDRRGEFGKNEGPLSVDERAA